MRTSNEEKCATHDITFRWPMNTKILFNIISSLRRNSFHIRKFGLATFSMKVAFLWWRFFMEQNLEAYNLCMSI